MFRVGTNKTKFASWGSEQGWFWGPYMSVDVREAPVPFDYLLLGCNLKVLQTCSNFSTRQTLRSREMTKSDHCHKTNKQQIWILTPNYPSHCSLPIFNAAPFSSLWTRFPKNLSLLSIQMPWLVCQSQPQAIALRRMWATCTYTIINSASKHFRWFVPYSSSVQSLPLNAAREPWNSL